MVAPYLEQLMKFWKSWDLKQSNIMRTPKAITEIEGLS